MPKYKSSDFIDSLKHAKRGVFLSIKSQKNFKADLSIALISLILAFYLKFSFLEFAVLFLTINSVLFAELINTVIEFIVDAYFGNRYSILAKMSKDISAGAVLLTATNALIVGGLLFLPKIVKIINLI